MKLKVHFSRGLTLIEILVVVAVVAVLQSIAVPAMADLINSSRNSAVLNTLYSSLIMARGDAILRNQRTVVCKSDTGDQCKSSGGWGQGWLVFRDSNNNAQLDADEQVLVRQGPVPSSVHLTGNLPVSRYVSFTPRGSAAYVSGAFQAGTLTVCSPSTGEIQAKQIVISIAGRPRMVTTTLESCPEI